MIVDADSHWTVPWEFDIGAGPLRGFADDLPPNDELFLFFIADNMLAHIPAANRPAADQLFPSRSLPSGKRTILPEIFDSQRTVSSPGDRLRWMDKRGIDYAVVNSAGFPAAYPLIKDLRKRQAYVQASNDLFLEETEGARHRLGIVTYADLTDVDWAIGELTRMRREGSRAFSVRAEPAGGKSLAHRDYDRLWSAVTDLGMILNLHVGLAPALFGSWGNFGRSNEAYIAPAYLRMANSQRHQAAELMVSALLFGGVFDRYPKLTLLIAELHSFWLPNMVRRYEALSRPGPLGPWPFERSARQQLNDQLRVSPLPGIGDFDYGNTITSMPDMVVFSSDYPHSEGNDDPIALYARELEGMTPEARANFLGVTMEQAFARTGDPLPTVGELM